MEAYRQNYYNVHCNQSKFTWFDSWRYPATVSHAISSVLIPLNIYCGYCILFKSPDKMRHTKWAMFNLHFWTSFLDCLVTTLLTPYIFLPLFCGFSVGLLNLIGAPVALQLFLIQCGLGLVGAALIIIFENRHNAIANDRFKMTRSCTRIAFYAFNCGIGVVFLLPVYFLVPEQEPAKLRMLEIVPCPTPEFFDPNMFVLLDMSNTELIGILTHLHFGILSVQGGFFVIRTIYYLMIKNPSLSESTRKLQRKVFKYICIQISIPMAVLVVPMVYLGASVFFMYYNQALTNTMVISLSFHGLSSTLAILVLYEPYWKFTKQVIYDIFGLKMPEKKVSAANISIVSTNVISLS